jgi:hypothetical protein
MKPSRPSFPTTPIRVAPTLHSALGHAPETFEVSVRLQTLPWLLSLTWLLAGDHPGAGVPSDHLPPASE